MQALDLPKNALQWETERQNRIHQEAVEQKKKQMRQEDAHNSLQPAEKIIREVALSRTPPGSEAGRVQVQTDVLRRIPDMRSALMPFDDVADGTVWSKPFSLLKANMEPWLSYYQGYKQSRLFLDAASGDNFHTVERSESSVDFAVRALLELKRASTKIILAPPVQINGQVEYLELEAELRACRDPLQAGTLLKYATEAHDSHLRNAIEKGRNLGNLLYDALMGEGHVNLIKAWEKVFKRKPSVEELHLMLTTGRVKVTAQRKPPVPEAKERPVQEMPAAPAIRQAELLTRPELPARPPSPTPSLNPRVKKDELLAATLPAHQLEAGDRKQKILMRTFHAVVGGAALAAYGIWMFA